MAEVKRKWIEGYEGLYEVTSDGNIVSHRKKVPYFCKNCMMTSGYHYVTVSVNGKRKNLSVHREVAKAFIPNPKGKKEVNHIDGDRLNNNVSNLEWATPKENITNALDRGVQFNRFAYTSGQRQEVINLRKRGLSFDEIERITGIPSGTAWHIAKRGY